MKVGMKTDITLGEKYGPAMVIKDQAAADAYFKECVRHCMCSGMPRVQAEDIERQNLGYYAGYYDVETRRRVERLFRCEHPIFGKVEVGYFRVPTAESAFAAGQAFGKALAAGKDYEDALAAARWVARSQSVVPPGETLNGVRKFDFGMDELPGGS